MSAFFVDPAYESLPATSTKFEKVKTEQKGFANWVKRNVFRHKKPGYAAVTLSLKKTGIAPGDATDTQLDPHVALHSVASQG